MSYDIQAQLREKHPLVYELMDDLKRRIAEAEVKCHDDMDELRIRDASRSRLNERYGQFLAEVDPMRRQIDALTTALADTIMYQPVMFAVNDGDNGSTALTSPASPAR